MRHDGHSLCGTMFPLLIALLSIKCEADVAFVQVPTTQLKMQTFAAAGADSYKSVMLYDNVLYIGGREKLFRQNPNDISESLQPPVPWVVEQSARSQCLNLPQGTREACSNFIRNIQPYNRSHLLVCGTMALSNKNMFFKIEEGTFHEADFIHPPLCSYKPEEPVTSVVLNRSPSFSSIASTSRILSQSQTVLVKTLPSSPSLQTTHGTGKMIDVNPDFVSSFLARGNSPKLYVVFGEGEPDTQNFGARIAQVCADDRGSGFRDDEWTTFLKVELQCQTNEASPFRFQLITHSVVNDDDVLYGTFVTSSFYLRTSAVCAYRLSDIERAFQSGKFYELSATGKRVISSRKTPSNPSPGECPYRGMDGSDGVDEPTTKNFKVDFVNFVWDHPEVASPVLPSGGRGPLLTLEGEYITKISVLEVRAVNSDKYDVIFVATQSGKVIKFAAMPKEVGIEMVKLAEFEVSAEPIAGLLLSDNKRSLYIQTKSKAAQISTGSCDVYAASCTFCDRCRMCILSRDPLCAWDVNLEECVDVRTTTRNSSVHVQSLMTSKSDRCKDLDMPQSTIPVPHNGVPTIIGDSVSNPSIDVAWSFITNGQTRELNDDSEGYSIATNKRLEIISFSDDDVGTYVGKYSVRGVLVAQIATIFADHSIDDDTKHATNTSLITTPRGRGGSSSGDIQPPTEPTGEPTTNSNRTTDFVITPTTAAGLSPGAIAGIIFAILVIIIVLFVVALCRHFGRVCFQEKKSKNVSDKKSPLKDSRCNDDVTDGVIYQNNSNNVALTAYAHGDAIMEEKQKLLAQETIQANPSLPLVLEKPEKKVAKVLPYEKADSNPSPIEYIDEVLTPTEEKQERKPPKRAKSIPSQKISIKMDDNRLFKCNSIHRGKERGTWFVEVEIPDEYLDDAETSGISHFGSEEKSNFASSEDVHRKEEDAEKSLESSSDPGAHGDFFTPSNLADPDTDSDSTLKASTIKLPDSSSSSASSTPRQFDTSRPLLPSSYNPRFAASSSPRGGASSEAAHPPQWHGDSLNSLMRKGSARSDKSPTSTDSSSSNSSDRFHTAPPSPVHSSSG